LERYSQSLEVYQEALAAYQKCRDRVGEARTFDGIGIVYRKLGQYSRTLDYYRQSLAQYRELGERVNEGDTLHNFGVLYSYLDQSPQALEAFHQALAINREIGDKAGERLTLSNIGFLLETQNQPELAIVFFKQSVNVTEAIRRDIRGLPKEQQQSYIETVASTYRRLADLLLKQDRILEAQRVSIYSKFQELEDYLRNVRGNNNTAQGLPNLPPEQQIEDSYESILDQAIQVGKELTQLRQIKPQNRNPQQEQRIAQLVKVQEQIIAQFNNFIESPEVEALINQLTRTAKRQNLELEDLIAYKTT
jgi:tetratricopeptide (TPR) repeat protein